MAMARPWAGRAGRVREDAGEDKRSGWWLIERLIAFEAVTPAQAGVQNRGADMDPGLRRGDGFRAMLSNAS